MAQKNTVLAQYNHHFKRINDELDLLLSSRIPLIEDIGTHSLLGPGKRLRPLLFILVCELCNYSKKDLYCLSTIFECIHTASLLHDDVLDNAEIRRKKPTANHLWGNHAAVLEGDFLHTTAIAMSIESENILFIKRVNNATKKMTEGQILELIHTDDWEISKKDYLRIITGKTAILISAACSCGAIISGADLQVVEKLGNYGLNLGIAFQLMDDVLDYSSTEEVFGKSVGKDIQEGKITLPLIYTLDALDITERKRLETLCKDPKEEACLYLIDFVRKSGSMERIREEAQQYVDEAILCLDSFPASNVKDSFQQLSQFVIDRHY